MSIFIIPILCLWLTIYLFRLITPKGKGKTGENVVLVCLSLLPKEEYVVLSDMTLLTETAFTQIDHIVVSVYGIFVIEVKNFKGWIYGNEQSTQWTQNIYGSKYPFMNPIRQNYAHVKTVEGRLSQYPGIPVISIVAFSPRCDLKVNTTSHVVYYGQICDTIGSYRTKVLEYADLAPIVDLLRSQNIDNPDVKKAQIAMAAIKKREFESLTVGSKCPKCSGTLVERQGKYGSFIGCSNYPNCRFTKQM